MKGTHTYKESQCERSELGWGMGIGEKKRIKIEDKTTAIKDNVRMATGEIIEISPHSLSAGVLQGSMLVLLLFSTFVFLHKLQTTV